ncbi:MAG TPA: hypothetical protein VF804_14915 [Holophagaceae bacterium]
MAVGPTRALLAAHFQASLARGTKEFSRQGVWALVLLGVALGGFVVLPIGLGLFLGGFYLGPRLAGPEAESSVLLLGALLAVLVGAGGILGGLLGGAKKLSWEQYRAFPIGRFRLLAAELVAGLGDLLTAGLALGLLAFTLGLAVGRPALLPLLPLLFLEHLVLVMVLQLLLGSLALRLARRLRLAVGLLLGVTWLGSMLLGQMTSRAHPLPPALAAAVHAVETHALAVLQALPTTAAVQGLQAGLEGHWGRALLLQLYPLGLGLLVALGAIRLLEREQEALAPVAGTGRERLWSFRTPPGGLARLQLRTLLGSHHGKFGFVMPLMTVVLIKGPMAMVRGQALWALPGAFAYLALFGNQFQFNQFGLDGHGVKGLFLLPLEARQLLDGKLRGFALYQGLQALLLIALLLPLYHPPLLDVAAALALAACFFLTQSAIGAFTSSWLPRRIDRASLKNNQMPLPLVFLSLGVSLACTAVFGGSYALLKWQAPALLLPGMAALAALCFGLHRLSRPAAAAYLDRRREVIVEAMG